MGFKQIWRVFADDRGSQFVEGALWLILFVLGVAVMIKGLADATGQKFQELTNRVNEVGSP